MQTLRWYRQRLASMSAGEIAWRVRASARDTLDRCLIPLNLRRPPSVPMTGGDGSAPEPGFRVSDHAVGCWLADAGAQTACWREGLAGRATAILEHRLSFFNLDAKHVGDPIDWHRDHEHGIPSPRGLSQSIDYRDFRVTGDAKNVWEPNRHQHLVVLSRAWRATGDPRFAREVVAQIGSWIAANPFGYGMNWRSPLEQAIRVINWVWALDLIRESGLPESEELLRIRESAWLHAWDVQRKYSTGSSANNHRIGEAAGVFVACTYWRDLPRAGEWAEESRSILEQEIVAQTFGDGGNREQAFGYHAFVVQFFLIAGMAARRSGRDFSARYWQTLERMIEFLAAMLDGCGEPPMYGDADDGYVLDLGGQPTDPRWLAGAGAVLFGRADMAAAARECGESAVWLLGPGAAGRFEQLKGGSGDGRLRSRAFPESGLYLLQSGHRGTADSISVLFDCGELGFRSIAAHGHADALGVMVRAFDHDILVDPGTFDYFTYPGWREYFRGTSAHNTLAVDGADQSAMLGAFMWGSRAAARCLAWEPDSDGGKVAGEHDGYRRLADPVRHERTVVLDGAAEVVTIADAVEAQREHEIALHFHLGEACRVVAVDGTRLECEAAGRRFEVVLDERLRVSVLHGTDQPGPGWVSRGYHRKVPSIAVRATGAQKGSTTYRTQLRFGPSMKGC